MDMYIRIVRHNSELEKVAEELYPLNEYCNFLSQGTIGLIQDVENILYKSFGESKSGWPEGTLESFNAIRHKLLDRAGELRRLPENITELTKEEKEEYIKEIGKQNLHKFFQWAGDIFSKE